MRKLIAATFAMIGSAAPAQLPSFPLVIGGADAKIAWHQVIASPQDDWINDLVRLRNGNILGVGFVGREDGNANADWQAVAAEMDTRGKLVSDRRYGAGGGTDAFWSVAEAKDGRRAFAGFTTRIGPGGINGFALFSRADGTLLREDGYGDSGYDRFTDVAPAAGGYVFVGHSQLAAPGSPRRTYIIKTDGSGQKLWERIYGGPETWSALYVEPAGDGGFLISGGTDGGGDGDMFLLKVDGEGRELWRKRVGTPDWDEINHSLLVRRDGTIVLVGYTNARGSDVHDIVAATLSKSGELQRLERFGGGRDERVTFAKEDSDGRVWIVGHTESAGEGGTDLMLTSLDKDGAFAGTVTTLGWKADDMGTALLPLGKDAILVAGYSRNLGQGGQDAFVARLTRPAIGKAHPAFTRTVVTPAR
jgi:hypothetical protein